MLLSVQAFSATVQCAKAGRSYYPVSKDAIALAEYLEVKTCGNKNSNFQAYLRDNGIKMQKVKASSELKQRVAAAAKAKRAEKLKGFAF